MKKIIFLGSLLSVVAIFAVDSRPFSKQDPAYTPYMGLIGAELTKTRSLHSKNSELECHIESELLQTEEGKSYEKAFSETPEARILALAKLQERPEYPKYLSVITKRDYYAIKERGLERARDFAQFELYRFDSEKDAMREAIDSMRKHDNAKPSNIILDWTNDIASTEKEVQKELQSFVYWMDTEDLVKRVERLTP